MSCTVWVGARLPRHLAAYQSREYTYERWVEDRLNGRRGPHARYTPIKPRPLQVEAARAIITHAAAGGPEFLLADEPGVGKTLSAVLAAKGVLRVRPPRNSPGRVLVIADRPAPITIPHWANTIGAHGDDDLEWVIVTYDGLEKVAAHKWDVVIADEAQMVRHTATARWGYFARAAGLTRKTRHPFLIVTTATPYHEPTETPYLAPALAHRFGGSVKEWANDKTRFDKYRQAGFHVEGRKWSDDPRERSADMRRLRHALERQQHPAMIARPAPWGPANLTAMPVWLSPAERDAYEQTWAEFCEQMDLARSRGDASRGRAALMRFRQKAGMVRIPTSVEWIAAQVERGMQVCVSTQFVSTAAQPLYERLRDLGIDTARIHGGVDNLDMEQERLRFQLGRAPVVVFTPTASISLHANEQLSGGRQASPTPRVGLIHQPRYSGIQCRQIVGRAHRDHQRCDWHVPYGVDTAEEKVGKLMAERYAITVDSIGGDTGTLAEFARILHADWLPSTAIEGPDGE